MSTLIEPCIAGCGRSGPVPAGYPALTAYLCPECRAKEMTMTEDTRTQQWVRIEKDRWERVRSAAAEMDYRIVERGWGETLPPGDLDPVTPEPTELSTDDRENLAWDLCEAYADDVYLEWCRDTRNDAGDWLGMADALLSRWHITRRAE